MTTIIWWPSRPSCSDCNPPVHEFSHRLKYIHKSQVGAHTQAHCKSRVYGNDGEEKPAGGPTRSEAPKRKPKEKNRDPVYQILRVRKDLRRRCGRGSPEEQPVLDLQVAGPSSMATSNDRYRE